MAFWKRAVGVGNGLWLANRHPPHKGQCRPPQDVLQAYWGKFEPFRFSRDATKKKNGLAAWEASLKRGGNCGIHEKAVASLSSSASKKSPSSTVQITILMLRIVQFVKRLTHSNKWRVRQRFFTSYIYCTNCHVRALFVNGHRLANNCHVHEWDVVVSRFFRQHGLERLAWRVLRVKEALASILRIR